MSDDGAFEILPPTGGRESPVVVHVPHAGTHLPADARRSLLVDDTALAEELLRLTDHRTDVLAAGAAAHGATRFVNRTSRLVVDPERLPDGREPMAAAGMGAVYTHGYRGEEIRPVDPAGEELLLERYFRPYAAAFAALVSDHLARFGACTIIDLHSYPSQRLPYELGTGPRPPLCIGTDGLHTPAWLTDLVVDAAHRHDLDVAFDTPFAGTYVPLDAHGADDRVTSVMLELRRDLYLDEEAAVPHAGERTVGAFVSDVVASVAAHHLAG